MNLVGWFILLSNKLTIFRYSITVINIIIIIIIICISSSIICCLYCGDMCLSFGLSIDFSSLLKKSDINVASDLFCGEFFVILIVILWPLKPPVASAVF